MAPKTNSKAAAAKTAEAVLVNRVDARAQERKAGAAAEKDAAAARASEAREAEEWSKGAKGKGSKDDKAAKAAEAAARKAESARLLAEEEASLKTAKPSPKAGPKKSAKPAAPSVPSFDDGLAADGKGKGRGPVEEYSASNIDDALDAMTIATAKTDKASVGARAAIAVDTHPERRYKAAFEAYKEATLSELRKDRPGLRLQQYNEIMYNDFKKHPDNPFNQVTVAYDATKAEKVAALAADQELKAARLRSGA